MLEHYARNCYALHVFHDLMLHSWVKCDIDRDQSPKVTLVRELLLPEFLKILICVFLTRLAYGGTLLTQFPNSRSARKIRSQVNDVCVILIYSEIKKHEIIYIGQYAIG